ncbi:hypothetical protein [Nocardiopsis coralliicola]
MIGRLAYLVAGAALGGYVVHKLNRTARAWSPDGIADRVEGRIDDYRSALREFTEDVHAATAQAEGDLLRRYARPPALPRHARDGHDIHGVDGAADAPEKKDGP